MNILYVEGAEVRLFNGPIKDVPAGLEYWILSLSELPKTRDFRDAWTWDNSRPADGVGQ